MTQRKLTREGMIKRDVVYYLRIKGWFVVNMFQSLGSYNGLADLYAIKEGRSVWIELKTPEGVVNNRTCRAGKQSKHQVKYEQDIKEHGGEYHVIRSIDEAMERF